jgi:NitT/TauT family transport system permease protein
MPVPVFAVATPAMALTLFKHSPERRSALWLDALVLFSVGAVVMGIGQVAAQWRHPLLATVDIDLSLKSLPRYTFFTFVRGWIAYLFSLLFTLVIASWAFYDLRARRYILPALDILQSLPVLTFLPGLEFALVALFPNSNAGLELACILSIFLSQVWNMTFSYYDSLRGTPADFRMLGKLYNFNWWGRFWRVELPFGAQGLLYNSMVSMAGGWFYLTVCEAFASGNRNFKVPGIGSYMAEAMARSDVRAEIAGVVAMGAIILFIDRLIWWPLVVWSRKFKLDDFGGNRAPQTSLQLWLARSQALQILAGFGHKLKVRLLPPPVPPSAATSLVAPGAVPPPPSRVGRTVYVALLVALVGLLAWGGMQLFWLIGHVHLSDWLEMSRDAAASFIRVFASVLLGTLWTVPFGVWIGLNPKLSGRLQPFIQFAASFPAPMIYPWLLALVFLVHGTLQWGSVLLILFGTQWYILFNVAGAAAAIPNDMISCSEILHLSGWRRWSKFLLPAIMPGLVIGWITAAGGAWNATIVAEYVTNGNKTYEATGLGDYISNASNAGNFPQLAGSAILMAVIVVVINRTLWKRLQTIANDRCRFLT